MTFDDVLPEILLSEGGYVNDPDDSGGATNKGITQATFDAWRKAKGFEPKKVAHIQDKEVAAIYYQNYWLDGQCDKLPVGVSLVHFDFGVNAGIGRAAKKLQEVVGVTIDGKIGSQTLAAVASYDPEKLVTNYSKARRDYYRNIVLRKPSQSKFLKSWLNRTDRCERLALAAIRRENIRGAGTVSV